MRRRFRGGIGVASTASAMQAMQDGDLGRPQACMPKELQERDAAGGADFGMRRPRGAEKTCDARLAETCSDPAS